MTDLEEFIEFIEFVQEHETAKRLAVPVEIQDTNWSCGAASMAAVARYFGVEPDTEDEAIIALPTSPSAGTDPQAFPRVARQHGLEAQGRDEMTLADLGAAIAAGSPVIVPMQAYGSPEEYAAEEAGHYVIVLDINADVVSIMDPASVSGYLDIAAIEFEANWHDRSAAGKEYDHYGIVFTKPGQLTEAFAPGARPGSDVGIGGKAGGEVEGLLDASVARGSEVLQAIARSAVKRLLAKERPSVVTGLFTDDERQELADVLAAVLGTSDQLARALIRDYLQRMLGLHPEEIHESKDAAGHEHKGKGKGGGQFTSSSGGDDGGEAKAEKKPPSAKAELPKVSSSVPAPPEILAPAEVQKTYIEDAAKIANLEITRSRVARLERDMTVHDERWSKTHDKIVKLGDEASRLEIARKIELDKYNKMFREFQASRSFDKLSFTHEEFKAQEAKVEEANVDLLVIKMRASDQAWSEIKRANNDPKAYITTIKNIKLQDETLFVEQKGAIKKVEVLLSGVVAHNLEQRINETVVRSIDPTAQSQRPYFKGKRHSGSDEGIYLSRLAGAQIVAHELGHSIEGNANVQAAAQGFLYSRVGAEPAKPMGDGYGAWEVGRVNDFAKAFGPAARYVGKHYKTDDTEIISMGLEKLVSDPVHFAKADPQYFKFMLGILDGSLL